MNHKEKELFMEMAGFKTASHDRLRELVGTAATPEVLGHIFFNRMQGISYGVLKENKVLGGINREFRNSLREAYEHNVTGNYSYYECVGYLNRILSSTDRKYAMLKGAVLCGLYPEGYRRANDIDILVHTRDISVIGNILLDNGFKQGHIINGRFEPAQRREIIESKMMRGETVPYIKRINLPEMKYLEVDINYSLDYKNSEKNTVDMLLNNTVNINIEGKKIRTLCGIDFFLHLCAHLYKEATVYPWIKMKRDMSLYKYSDIYMMLYDGKFYGDRPEKLFERAKELNLTDVLCFAVMQTAELFGLDADKGDVISAAGHCINENEQILHTVINPAEKKTYIYRQKDIRKRFFNDNRTSLLKEI